MTDNELREKIHNTIWSGCACGGKRWVRDAAAEIMQLVKDENRLRENEAVVLEAKLRVQRHRFLATIENLTIGQEDDE